MTSAYCWTVSDPGLLNGMFSVTIVRRIPTVQPFFCAVPRKSLPAIAGAATPCRFAPGPVAARATLRVNRFSLLGLCGRIDRAVRGLDQRGWTRFCLGLGQ